MLFFNILLCISLLKYIKSASETSRFGSAYYFAMGNSFAHNESCFCEVCGSTSAEDFGLNHESQDSEILDENPCQSKQEVVQNPSLNESFESCLEYSTDITSSSATENICAYLIRQEPAVYTPLVEEDSADEVSTINCCNIFTRLGKFLRRKLQQFRNKCR
ncbi:hypothetical protein M153_4760003855 [Pseudoloma neurophilia]|uniref:Uncharacterized protein n=1 Tax=Pseudoloma neurophilia TaxID=146866 RepID=A0A0R0LXA3_9MICR|nr:hypothetical protein M153_4760003855 [Pseudoloma neurophilia]